MRPSVRTLLVALAALAVWLVAWPARAAAPLCDDRAASGFAPPPTLDLQNASVDIGMNPDACDDGVERDASLHQGRGSDPLPSPTLASALPVDGRILVVARPAARRTGLVDAEAEPTGVRGRLERPPRG